jgi:hypothetical protein
MRFCAENGGFNSLPLYFFSPTNHFERLMTRRFLILIFIAGGLANVRLLCAESTNNPLAKAAVLENNVAYLRVSQVIDDLAVEIQSAQKALAATNKIIGTVLDLRFADGGDRSSAKAAASLFAAQKMPLAILVNGQTHDEAAALAAMLSEAHEGLIFGSTTPGTKTFGPIQPDITVPVEFANEKKYLDDPYAALVPDETNAVATTNDNLAPFIDHTSEADLVREKIKDGDEDEDSMPAHPTEPQKPYIHDPVLGRAVDLIKALAVIRQSRA